MTNNGTEPRQPPPCPSRARATRRLKTAATRGFSLMEVNMAVFVVAVGVLSMVALYPLGLRESTQGQADLRQSMFADYVINQAVAAASQTNILWSEWTRVPRVQGARVNLQSSVPAFIRSRLDFSEYPDMIEDRHFRIAAVLAPGMSDRIMGILVQSTDLVQSVSEYSQWSNNPVFYAEVMFQGDPTR